MSSWSRASTRSPNAVSSHWRSVPVSTVWPACCACSRLRDASATRWSGPSRRRPPSPSRPRSHAEVAGHAVGVVAVEEHALAGERRQRDHDVDLALGLPRSEPVLERDRRDETTRAAAALDRGDVDRDRAVEAVEGDRVTRLVDRDRVPLTLDVLPVVGYPVRLLVFRLEHVGPRDRVASVADREHERLVHGVLDRRAGGVGRDHRELLDLLVGELVLHLGEVTLERALPPVLRRVADLVDAVDAARPQQRLVKRVRHVRGHDHEPAVLGRRLRPHAQRAGAPRG